MKRFASIKLSQACSALFRLSDSVDRVKTLNVVNDFVNENIDAEAAIAYFENARKENRNTYADSHISKCIDIIKEESSI